MTEQSSLFQEVSPAAEWERDFTRRALDELFTLARQYKSSRAYFELLRFVKRFRFYSPFNAMLIYTQMPGARFVASPNRWLRDYRRQIKIGARPIVILQPMGPVMFVFDVSDTEALPDAPDLPIKVTNPFAVRGRDDVVRELNLVRENAKRDGISISDQDAGSQHAGQISTCNTLETLRIRTKAKPEPEYVSIPVRYKMLLNVKLTDAAKFATLVHELGHLYCGHLGTHNEKWWPNRYGLSHEMREFEAESVCYLVCSRLGIENPSDEYLAGYLRQNDEVPPISLDCVMKAVGLIEQMAHERLKLRKEKEK